MPQFLAALAVGAITWAIAKIITIILVFIACVISFFVLSALESGLFDYLCNWVSIPALGQVIIWGQTISIAVVIAIRIGIGLNEGILTDRQRAPEYLFKSIAAIAAIGIMPIAVDLIIGFVFTSMSDVVSWLSAETYSSEDAFKLIEQAFSELAQLHPETISEIAGRIVGPLFLLIACVYVVKIYLQLMVRQFQMLIISVVAPWVGIKSATESSSGQYWEFLANLLGMGLTQILQGVFLWIALKNFHVWTDAGVILGFDLADPDSWYSAFIMLGLFIATSSIETLIDRWTFSGGPSSSSTSAILGRFGHGRHVGPDMAKGLIADVSNRGSSAPTPPKGE